MKKVSKQFPELFHYTNLTAFKKIYETNIFRATHYKDLNDSSEFSQFRLKVHEFIRPKIQTYLARIRRQDVEIERQISERGGIDSVAEENAIRHVDTMHEHTFNERMYKQTFVCSFCGHLMPSYEASHGLLSQWRAYGVSDGVVIVLDTERVEKMLERDYYAFQIQISMMGDVVYDDNNKRIKKDYGNVFKHLPKIIEIEFNKLWFSRRSEVEELYADMHDHFLLGSVLVKHRAFKEENELRIVVAPNTAESFTAYDPNSSKKKKEISWIPKDNREIRYIEMFGNEPLPIKRIIVGPSKIQNFNYQTVRDIVGENTDIEILKSEIPFLG